MGWLVCHLPSMYMAPAFSSLVVSAQGSKNWHKKGRSPVARVQGEEFREGWHKFLLWENERTTSILTPISLLVPMHMGLATLSLSFFKWLQRISAWQVKSSVVPTMEGTPWEFMWFCPADIEIYQAKQSPVIVYCGLPADLEPVFVHAVRLLR